MLVSRAQGVVTRIAVLPVVAEVVLDGEAGLQGIGDRAADIAAHIALVEPPEVRAGAGAQGVGGRNPSGRKSVREVCRVDRRVRYGWFGRGPRIALLGLSIT